jgi:hypothetical protein
MNVRLVVEHGARRRVMNLRPPEAVLGRAHGNTIRIPSAEVSRRHCRLTLADGLVTLEDLDSVNGTFLNGRKIDTIEYVQPGDQIEVGPVRFTVEYELTPEAMARLGGNDLDEMEQLAEFELMDEVADEADLATLEPMDDEDLPVLEALDAAEDLPEVQPVAEDEGDLIADFELDESDWQDNEEDLQDQLRQLEADADAPTHYPRPKKRP